MRARANTQVPRWMVGQLRIHRHPAAGTGLKEKAAGIQHVAMEKVLRIEVRVPENFPANHRAGTNSCASGESVRRVLKIWKCRAVNILFRNNRLAYVERAMALIFLFAGMDAPTNTWGKT